MADSLNDALQELDEMSVVTSGDTLVINNDLRTITVPNNFIFGVYNDKNVLSVDFEMPRYYDDIDLSTFSIQINYQAASGVGNIYEITTPVVGTDKITFEWLLDRGVFLKAGDVTFIVCLREILSGSDGTVLREFNTTVARGKVLEGLEVEDPDDPEAYSIIAHLKSIDQRVTAQASDVANKFAAVSSMASEATSKYNEAISAINGAKEFYGSPLVAATAAAMTDTNKVYVYTGSETGYTAGNWYHYDGTNWVSGGVYNSAAVNTDETLSVSGMAADSAKVGQEISGLKEDFNNSQNTIKIYVADITGNEIVYYSKGWIETSGNTVDINTINQGDFVHAVVPCVEGDQFTISGTGAAAARLWAFITNDGSRLTVASASETQTNYVIKAPANSAYLVLNARTSSEKIGCFKGTAFYTQYLEDKKNFANTEYLSALIPSSYSQMILVDTINKTITIPEDTLIPVLMPQNYYYYLQIGGTIEYGNLGTGAFKVYYDISNNEFVLKTFRQRHPDNAILIMTVRNSPFQINVNMDYVVNGQYMAFDYYNSEYVKSYTNGNIKVINHRGYNTIAPENTMPAFKLSRKLKYMYIETDVQFTAPDANNPNGVAVLLHDETINRTARNTDGTEIANTIRISDITYEQALQYDFTAGKSGYEGTKIPTLSEFLTFCKNTGVHPYLELKTGNSTQLNLIFRTVRKTGMRGRVTYISQSVEYLTAAKNADSKARIGYIVSTISQAIIDAISTLKTDGNEVICDLQYTGVTDAGIDMLSTNDIPLELWTINSLTQITSEYASGYTTDMLKVWSQLYNSVMD